MVVGGIRLRDQGHEEDGNGIGDGAGEQDTGHCHAGKNTVDGERLLGAIAEFLQADGDPGGFHSAKQMQTDTVCRQGRCKEKNAADRDAQGICRAAGKIAHFYKVQTGHRNGNQRGGKLPNDQADRSHIDREGDATLAGIVPE